MTGLWNLTVQSVTGPDGQPEKALDIDIFGVIGDSYWDDVRLADIAKQLADNADAKRITVRINSEGGGLFSGVAIYNLLSQHPAEVTSLVLGQAASSASVIAMAGRTVMARGAMLFVHNPWTVAMGDARELRRVAADLDKARDSLIAIYQAKTGKDATALKALLDGETWMTAEQARRNGFADEIADEQVTTQARGNDVLVAGVAFPRACVAPAILNRLSAAPQPAPPPAAAPEPPPAPPLTRDALAKQAPDLLAALLAEGHVAGVADERSRLQAIDDLAQPGHADLIAVAKYGAEPLTAEQVAVAIVKTLKAAGDDILARRREESAVAASVRARPMDELASARAEQLRKHAVAAANARRGGPR